MATGDGEDPRVRQLGEYIRLQRQMADLSLRGMAELTKVSNAYLSQIERGLHQPSLRVLQAIAEALNIPADTLLTQAGVVSRPADRSEPPTSGTEEAIRSDPALTPEEREALLRIYRSFVEGRSSSAT
jgi:transcriptional regulator with XRE-family HTH domain